MRCSARATRCPVLTLAIPLRTQFAMSGTDVGYPFMHMCELSGSDIGYPATPSVCDVRYRRRLSGYTLAMGCG
eukprot:2017522-Rhodomonas_salina.1